LTAAAVLMHTASPANSNLAALYASHVRVMQDRAAAALGDAPLDGLLIFAGDLAYPGRDDIPLPFRVEPHFAAWLPLLEQPGCALRVEPGRRPLLAYVQNEDFWHTPRREPEGFWVEHFDIRTAASADEAARLVMEPGKRFAMIGADARGNADSSDVSRRLDFLRAFKTDYEVACMQAANRIAVRGHAAAAAAPRHHSEFALHQTYCGATEQREIELPYPNIVALNEHASILHYEHLDLVPPPVTRSLLIDAGAAFNGYASDVTRTWSEPGCLFAELVSSMDRLQQAICARMTEGADFVGIHEGTHELLADVLHAHGLVTCSADTAYESGLTRVFLPHGLGHLLGLQVHDIGGHQIAPDGEQRAPPAEHPFLRLTRTLAGGMAVTVEPGLYFIESLLRDAPARLRRLINRPVIETLMPYGGIRIEDDVLITPGACRNLTREAFAQLET
jgi:Xaa-Pro dipeptidase